MCNIFSLSFEISIELFFLKFLFSSFYCFSIYFDFVCLFV